MTYPERMIIASLAALAAAMTWLVPGLVMACGAFVPLDGDMEDREVADLAGHEREQMLYIVDDGELTVYQGRSFDGVVQEFAWLLPVPGTPQIEMAPTDIFAKLDDHTSPSFVLDDESDGDCPAEVKTLEETKPPDVAQLSLLGPSIDGGEVLGLGAGRPSAQPAVRVVDTGEVGPFEHTTIATREGLRRPGERALEWLEDHDYALEAVDHEVLDSYLRGGSNLLAFRLHADADTDDIQPVAITVDAEQAMSPIRLGAMGADDNTHIQVWVAAPHPVLPENYKRVKPNQGLIDWMDDGSNYDAVVAEAVEEAGGQAFAVDATMDTSKLDKAFIASEQIQRWEELRQLSPESPEERRDALLKIGRLLDDIAGEDTLEIVDELESMSDDFLDYSAVAEWSITDNVLLGKTVREPRMQDDEAGLHHEISRDAFEGGLDEAALCHKKSESIVPGQAEIAITLSKSPDEPVTIRRITARGFRSLEKSDCYRRRLSSAIDDEMERLENLRATTGSDEDGKRLIVEARFLVTVETREPGEVSIREWMGLLTNEELAQIEWDELVEGIDDELITRRVDAQRRLESLDRITRLSTTMSPEDMTRDAYFIEVPEADPVSRTRRAARTIVCGDESEQRTKDYLDSETRVYTTRDWRFEPPRGTVVEGHGDQWPLSIGDVEAAYVIEPPISDDDTLGLGARPNSDPLSALFRVLIVVFAIGLPIIGLVAWVRRR